MRKGERKTWKGSWRGKRSRWRGRRRGEVWRKTWQGGKRRRGGELWWERRLQRGGGKMSILSSISPSSSSFHGHPHPRQYWPILCFTSSSLSSHSHQHCDHCDHCDHPPPQVWHASPVSSDGEFWEESEPWLYWPGLSTGRTCLPSRSLPRLTLNSLSTTFEQVIQNIRIVCCRCDCWRNIYQTYQLHNCELFHPSLLFCVSKPIKVQNETRNVFLSAFLWIQNYLVAMVTVQCSFGSFQSSHKIENSGTSPSHGFLYF